MHINKTINHLSDFEINIHRKNKKNFEFIKIKNIIRKLNAIQWFIIDMMIVKQDFFTKLYPKDLETKIKEEIKIAKITKKSKVLHIGCGPYPITAILINKLTGAKVLAVDKTILAADLARKYIEKKHIRNVEIKKTNGKNCSIKDFDVIIITAAVTPRKEVIDNILNNKKNNCIIINRELKEKHKNKSYEYKTNNNSKNERSWHSSIITKKTII